MTSQQQQHRENNEEELLLTSPRRRRNQENVDEYQGHEFGEKLSFTVGMSYICAASVGFVKGLIEARPQNWRQPRKLILNNFFNKCGKETFRFANASAAAGLLYFLNGQILNFWYQEEFADYSIIFKNMMCGFFTGAIYKSTLGMIPCVVGGVLGMSLIGGLTKINQILNEKGVIAFEMKF